MPYLACDEWREGVLAEIETEQPDVVILTNYTHYYGWLQDADRRQILSASDAEVAWLDGISATVNRITTAGSEAVAIRDNPEFFASYRDCLSTSDDCARPRADALRGMASWHPSADLIQMDFTDDICDPSSCPAIKNGAIIYQDNNHLTATFTAGLWGHFLRLLERS